LPIGSAVKARSCFLLRSPMSATPCRASSRVSLRSRALQKLWDIRKHISTVSLQVYDAWPIEIGIVESRTPYLCLCKGAYGRTSAGRTQYRPRCVPLGATGCSTGVHASSRHSLPRSPFWP
jgi:hypothetical protein